MTLLDWIGLSANDTEQEQLQEVARWQQTTCSHDVQASSDEWIRDFLMTVEDNREVLSTWADCVREVVSAYDSCIRARSGQPRGLMILPDHEPGEGQFFTLNIRWCGVGGELLGGSAEVTGRLRVEGAECEEEGRYGQGCALCIGDGRLVCRRRGSSEVVASLTVEARSGNAARTYSASAWLPALCQPGTGRCSEDVLERCDDLRHWYFERECPDTCVEGACEPICDAGERRECRCADGSTGTQDCSVDGLSLSACDCYEVCDQQDNDGDGQTDEEVTGLDSDPANCGACFHVCAAQLTHTEGISCEAGVCSFGQCAAGFSDGDGDAGNGCELSCRERNLFRAEDLLCEHNRGSCSDVRGALDEDDATAYSCNTGRVQAPQGSVHCTLLAQREFDVPRHISAFEFHLMAYGADTGAYARDRHAEYGIYYRIVGDQADSWRPVDDGGRIPWDGGRPGGDGDLGNDSGFARIAVDLHDVTAVRVLASGSGNAAGGEGTAQGAAAFYRVAAFGEPCD